jgi:hypothetical protein
MKMNGFVGTEQIPDRLRDIIIQSYEDINIDDCEMVQTMHAYDPWIKEGPHAINTCILIIETYGIWFNTNVTSYLEYTGVLTLLKR